MALDIPVFDYLRARNTSNITEMVFCSECSTFNGVFVSSEVAQHIGFNRSGLRFDRVVWEKWHCLSCGKHWTQVYGVRDE